MVYISKKHIRFTMVFLLISFQLVRSQSNLTTISSLLTHITTDRLPSLKTYIVNHDSLQTWLYEKWVNNEPIDFWFDRGNKIHITMIYKRSEIDQLLIKNISDTAGLHAFYSKNRIVSCQLFRGSDKFSYRKKKIWTALFKFSTALKKPVMMNFEIVDSTLHYLEVIKNPIFVYNYGFACYEDGEPPIGRIAIDYLIRNDKVKLLSNFSECLNNEGLMYIVEYYVKQKMSIPAGIRKGFSKKISYCDGCTESGSMSIQKMVNYLNDSTSTFGSYIHHPEWYE